MNSVTSTFVVGSGAPILFYDPWFYGLSNFSAHQVVLGDMVFPTAEHAFQASKFTRTSPTTAEQILKAASPYQAKQLAARFKSERAGDWNETKVEVMKVILFNKMAQHADVREMLVNTGDRTLIENSPTDEFLGSGAARTGQNMLGKLWMKIREDLKQGRL